MEYIRLWDGQALAGEVAISGAKNSALPILAATLLCKGECLLHNCPRLTDINWAIALLQHLGCRVCREGHDIWVDSKGLCRCDLPETLMKKMRSSVFFLGPLLAKTGACDLCEPGGCCLGARPIDLHLGGLAQMGAEIRQEEDRLSCRGAKLHGAAIVLPFPSVGATENLMMAALGADSPTTIYNAAKEPEIVDLADFLQSGGAKIHGAGTKLLQIEPGLPNGAEYRIMPDRMEAATYLAAAAAAGGRIVLRDAHKKDMLPVCDVLESAGCQIQSDCDIIEFTAKPLRGCKLVRTAPYPGFPTDAQAVIMAALLRAEGLTVFEETVFASRFRHVPALRALGAQIETSGAIAVVSGVKTLSGTAMAATDLRGGAAMAVAALGAQGCSVITEIQHIQRGYEDFAQKLAGLGARIQHITEDKLWRRKKEGGSRLAEEAAVPLIAAKNGQ